jgi:hypothetical protein
MLVYWLMFLLPAGYALSAQAQVASPADRVRAKRGNYAWLASAALLTLVVGYRFHVGGDWGNYLRQLQYARYLDVYAALEFEDPAYSLLNLLASRQDWGIAGVNLVSALLFSIGLAVFCRNLPRPWLALAIAMPYLVTVVAMGYTRQSVALGLAMLGLVALTRKQVRWFVFWVICAATFHKSAVLLLPIAALAATRNKYWTALWMAVVSLGAYAVFLDRSMSTFYTNYVESQYQSQGAIVRTAMNFVPAVIYLAFRRRFQLPPVDASLWRWFSVFSILLFAASLLAAATTAVDRIALYMLPLQLVIFAHLPDALGRRGKPNQALVGLIVLYYACVLFVWLNYATNARYWLPYRFYPLESWF